MHRKLTTEQRQILPTAILYIQDGITNLVKNVSKQYPSWDESLIYRAVLTILIQKGEFGEQDKADFITYSRTVLQSAILQKQERIAENKAAHIRARVKKLKERVRK